MKKLITGVCRCCGQLVQFDYDFDVEDEEMKNNLATQHCDCPDARKFVNRGKTLVEIEELFGEHGEEFVSWIANACRLLRAEMITSATVNIKSGLKCKVSMDAKGIVHVDRAETVTNQKSL